MKAIRAVVKDGRVVLSEPLNEKGPCDAVVVLLDDPWDRIVDDPRERPALAKAREEAVAESEAGYTTPLAPDPTP